MKKILAITSGKNTPSSRFRIRQHIDGLNKKGFYVTESCPPIDKNKSVPFLGKYNPRFYLPIYFVWQIIKILQRISIIFRRKKYDYVWLNRELLTGYYTLEGFLGEKVILDVDDAIWKNPPFGSFAAKKIAQRSYAIICGNDYLAEWFRQYNSNVYVIPTSVNVDKYKPRAVEYKSDIITLGWIGTHGNLKYVKLISSVLENILSKYSFVKIKIVCDKKFDFINNNESVEYVEWSEINEIKNFQSIDIGLMPLDEDEWTKGKCSFKLLQHLSCGSMVVGSPVGMNKNILLGNVNGAYPATSTDEWFDILSYLIDNYEEYRDIYKYKTRDFILENYASEKILSELIRVFND
ncbi:glycosyltransferase family 1 protein [Prodigiosinella confusarubida]|uniref:Glycosyltransferase family 1 protein n=1 Tax=Serratia sp. (strain ATCC 39006) TaxID=104623 RepID=A0A2I5TH01_SERS3|nr:glycosyltransferase [Serratia sp. ATCC 39006]AUG99489.1 glycosyltransferase family 1 protein [Serratia sp. ATCC 39006]AUH03807.1 glycosyltransferase family 1 protein [Serratia sp. ATCC 39006]